MKTPSTIFKNNYSLSQKINDMNNDHPYIHEAVKKHTQLMFDGKHPHLHKTPDNENAFVDGYLEGLSRGMDISQTLFEEAKKEAAPTVFTHLQNEEK